MNVTLIDSTGSPSTIQLPGADLSDVLHWVEERMKRDSMTYIRVFVFNARTMQLREFAINGVHIAEV